ncbi:hypothetical protein jhhlp_005878 [Lomentospora prolificans]|uniref:Large ribosomal subunit protein mL38 n=1 Tax=Lomentospora prolificans TaxID=41688 RepID=A0A2N3N4C5_9PEZI|nr:hypothetical protein jhhlp_005878 [Lomentospora prolificans]
MSASQVARPLVRGLRQTVLIQPATIRSFSLSSARFDAPTTTAEQVQNPADQFNSDPNTVLGRRAERELAKAGNPPVGSRRRRAALRSSPNVPFEQLPYQCFQEARAIIRADREEKVEAIRTELAKIARLEAADPSTLKGGERKKELRLTSLREHVEQLKILADINDPVVKRKFEDGLGDMDKPIYRYLADKKWRSYDRKVVLQRLEQFHIVPDLLPKFDPVADVQLFFRRVKVPIGAMVNSLVSELPPRLRVQVFDKGERLVSVVVVDADVPDVEADSFTKRCHYMAANVPVSPSTGSIAFSRIKSPEQLAVPWLPAFAHKGSPYHRLAVFVLEQRPGETLDVEKLKALYNKGVEGGFSLKSFRDKFGLSPIGFNMFRTVYDENTAAVMARAGIEGADLEFRRVRVHSMKPERKPKGWEAKRQGPKYKHLWKYTKRIRGLSSGKKWTKRGN